MQFHVCTLVLLPQKLQNKGSESKNRFIKSLTYKVKFMWLKYMTNNKSGKLMAFLWQKLMNTPYIHNACNLVAWTNGLLGCGAASNPNAASLPCPTEHSAHCVKCVASIFKQTTCIFLQSSFVPVMWYRRNKCKTAKPFEMEKERLLSGKESWTDRYLKLWL